VPISRIVERNVAAKSQTVSFEAAGPSALAPTERYP